MNENENLNQVPEENIPTVVFDQTSEAPVSSEPIAPTVDAPTPDAPKKNNTTPIIIIVVAALVILGGLFFVLGGKKKEDTKKETKTEEKEKEKKSDEVTIEDYRGIYQLKDKTIKIYPGGDGMAYYSLGEYNNGYIEFKKGILIDESFGEKLSFELTSKGIKVDSSEDPSLNGEFTKASDYTEQDLLKDVYGKPEYFTSKYNGIYEANKVKFYMYQTDEDSVRVITREGSWDISFDIEEDGSLYEEFFEDKYYITFGDKTMTFRTEGEDKEFDGTYNKVGDVTVSELTKAGIFG